MSKPTRWASNALDRISSYLLATQDFKIKGVFAPKIDILLPYSDITLIVIGQGTCLSQHVVTQEP